MSAGARICVAVCTFRRPQQLRLLLESLAAQSRRPDAVVVVDNDADGSARAVCEGGTWPFALRYLVEPQQNISLARNRAVAAVDGDWTGFLDDDEVAPPHWLETLRKCADAHGADAVLGPVVSEVPPQAPEWIRRGDFYSRRRFPTGTVVPRNEYRIGNALIRTAALRGLDPVFDPALGLSGGEDGDMLSRLASAGARIVWCDEAEVREPVAPERLRLRWLLLRALRGGQDYVRHLRAGRYGPAGPMRLAGAAARAVGALCLSLPMALLTLPAGRHHAVAWLRRGFAQFGKLSGLLGMRYEEYRR